MLDGRELFNAAGRYLRGHPEEIARIVRSSFGLRFGVPLAAFRWLVEHVMGSSRARDVEIGAAPPGLRLGATVEKMETTLRVSLVLYVHRIDIDADTLRVELRFEDVGLRVLSQEKTVLSALVKSGALDIAQIGDLVRELPGLPPFVVESGANRVTFDLMKEPRIGNNLVVRRAVGLLSSLITVHGVQTESEHLDVVFRALPRGATGAVTAVESFVVNPGLRALKSWWNGGGELPPVLPERF